MNFSLKLSTKQAVTFTFANFLANVTWRSILIHFWIYHSDFGSHERYTITLPLDSSSWRLTHLLAWPHSELLAA